MASIIHALPSGPENGGGLSDGDTPAPEVDREVCAGLAGPDRPTAPEGFERVPAPGADRIKPSDRSLRHHLAISDAVALAAVWASAALVATGAGWDRQVAAAAAILASVVAMRGAGLYRTRSGALPSREATRVVASTGLGALAFVASGWLVGSAYFAEAVAGASISAMLVLALRWRFVRWLRGKRSVGQHLHATILVGTNDDAIAVWTMLTDEPALGYRIVGVVGEERGDAPWTQLPQAAEITDLPELATQTGADSVIVVAGALPARATSETVNRVLHSGLDVQIWPGYLGLSTRRVHFAPVSGLPVFSVEPPGAPNWQMAVKRATDILITVGVSPLVLPILVAAAIGIKLEDGGPVFYHHRALGRDGNPITVLKLRSMVPNAAQLLADVAALNERTGGPLFKATNDPRVTRIGRVLRATSVDELPQLWDVLMGTMSLVGPRFAAPHEDARFAPELRRRYAMRPGITGLWQSEARDNPAFSAYQRLDLLYVDNWSLGLDLAILANTAHAVTVRALKAIFRAGSRLPGPSAPEALVVAQVPVPEHVTTEAAGSQ